MDKLDFTGSFSAFVEQCQDPSSGQFYRESKHMLEGYQILNDRITSLLPAFFETLPASPLQLEELHAASAPAAFYMQGTVDLTRPGKFYVNVSNLEKRPIYNMTALALHEVGLHGVTSLHTSPHTHVSCALCRYCPLINIISLLPGDARTPPTGVSGPREPALTPLPTLHRRPAIRVLPGPQEHICGLPGGVGVILRGTRRGDARPIRHPTESVRETFYGDDARCAASCGHRYSGERGVGRDFQLFFVI